MLQIKVQHELVPFKVTGTQGGQWCFENLCINGRMKVTCMYHGSLLHAVSSPDINSRVFWLTAKHVHTVYMYVHT